MREGFRLVATGAAGLVLNIVAALLYERSKAATDPLFSLLFLCFSLGGIGILAWTAYALLQRRRTLNVPIEAPRPRPLERFVYPERHVVWTMHETGDPTHWRSTMEEKLLLQCQEDFEVWRFGRRTDALARPSAAVVLIRDLATGTTASPLPIVDPSVSTERFISYVVNYPFRAGRTYRIELPLHDQGLSMRRDADHSDVFTTATARRVKAEARFPETVHAFEFEAWRANAAKEKQEIIDPIALGTTVTVFAALRPGDGLILRHQRKETARSAEGPLGMRAR